MLELVRIAIGRGSVPRTEAFWRWKHEQNPFGPSPAMVAEADGRIVSLRIFLRWRWLYGKYAYAAVRPVDTATHPDWRRRGLFERLTRELLQVMKAEGVAFVFNTPNATSGRGYEKLGWRMVGRPTIWVRPVKPVRLLAEFARREARRGLEEAPQRFEATSTAILTSPDLGGLRKTHLPQQVPSHDRRRCRLPGLALPRLPWPRLRRDGRVRPHLGRTSDLPKRLAAGLPGTPPLRSFRGR